MCEIDADVDWVDVSIEPHHVEQFRNEAVRVYEATIAPGTATQYHRHNRDTLYVVTSGGRFRTDEPRYQRTATTWGHSTPLRRQMRWRLTRALPGGWISMPAGTVLAQPHQTLPLIHRVTAHHTNVSPIRLIGIERHHEGQPHGLPCSAGINVEYRGPCGWAYRVQLPPGDYIDPLQLPGGGVLVVISGTATATTSSQGQTKFIGARQALWLADQTQLHSNINEPFHALLVNVGNAR